MLQLSVLSSSTIHGGFPQKKYYQNKIIQIKSLGERGRYKSYQNVLFGKIVENKTPFKSLVLWLPGSFDELAGNVVV